MPSSRVPERSAGASGHRELDLLTLATSYADAVGDLEATQAKMADIDALAKQSPTSISKQEVTSARLAVAAAQRKQQLLQRIATVALKMGNIATSELEESQTRAEILKQILSTHPGNEDSALRR